METIRLSANTMSEAVAKASEVLRRGGVVLYPTDTLYGLGADAFSDEAIAKVYEIKGRNEGKPIHCVVSNIEMAALYAAVDSSALELAKAFLPGPLTLILKKKSEITGGIANHMDTIGIRIPKSDFCTELTQGFDGPITTTSANISGVQPEMTPEKILAQLGESAELIDLVIDVGELPASKPSTIVDISGNEPAILREGQIMAEEIWDILRKKS